MRVRLCLCLVRKMKSVSSGWAGVFRLRRAGLFVPPSQNTPAPAGLHQPTRGRCDQGLERLPPPRGTESLPLDKRCISNNQSWRRRKQILETEYEDYLSNINFVSVERCFTPPSPCSPSSSGLVVRQPSPSLGDRLTQRMCFTICLQPCIIHRTRRVFSCCKI
jgi:hypothetical protein